MMVTQGRFQFISQQYLKVRLGVRVSSNEACPVIRTIFILTMVVSQGCFYFISQRCRDLRLGVLSNEACPVNRTIASVDFYNKSTTPVLACILGTTIT